VRTISASTRFTAKLRALALYSPNGNQSVAMGKRTFRMGRDWRLPLHSVLLAATLMVAYSALADPTKNEQELFYAYCLRPTAGTCGSPMVRVLIEPSHGQLRIQRNACIPRLWYIPNAGFSGVDRASFETVFPNGQVCQVFWEYSPSGQQGGARLYSNCVPCP
jgi:hypothetical protein